MAGSMRLAIPTEGSGGIDAPRSAHFGHAGSFTIIDVVDGALNLGGVLVNPPHESGGCGRTVDLLAEYGVQAAIVVGMGGGPRAAMESHGMQALFDDRSATPRQAAEAYITGDLGLFGADQECAGH